MESKILNCLDESLTLQDFRMAIKEDLSFKVCNLFMILFIFTELYPFIPQYTKLKRVPLLDVEMSRLKRLNKIAIPRTAHQLIPALKNYLGSFALYDIYINTSIDITSDDYCKISDVSDAIMYYSMDSRALINPAKVSFLTDGHDQGLPQYFEAFCR